MLKGSVLEKISPSKAKALLSRNNHNRGINDKIVREYARVMKSGQWEINGETIKIAEDGTLIDGQHRLHAIIEADTTIETYVVYSLDKETFDTVDIGRKRTNGDMLSVDGVQNATATAAAIRWIHAYKTTKSNPNNHKLTSHEIREFYKTDEAAIDYAVTKGATAARGLMNTGIGAAMFYLFGKKSMPQTEYFFEALHTGIGLAGGSPILALRNRLINSRTGKAQLVPFEIAILVIRAWNAYRANTSLKVLTGSRKMDEDSTILMPTIK